MECELVGNILHIKSDSFKDKEIIDYLEENFILFLSMYFEHYKVSGIPMLIRDWEHLKEDFEISLMSAMMAKMAMDMLF